MKNSKSRKIIKALIIVVIFFVSVGSAIELKKRSHEPDISISIGDASSGGGKDIKIKAPYITLAVSDEYPPTDTISTRIEEIIRQHEALCKEVVEHYKASDIKLRMVVKDDTTILIYYGTAITMNDESVDFKKEIKLDFVLDAPITYQL